MVLVDVDHFGTPPFDLERERIARFEGLVKVDGALPVAVMQLGRTAGQRAVYLPNEDNWMLDRLPRERMTPGAQYWWEMRHVVPPAETDAYQPLWISTAFLASAEAAYVTGQTLHVNGGMAMV